MAVQLISSILLVNPKLHLDLAQLRMIRQCHNRDHQTSPERVELIARQADLKVRPHLATDSRGHLDSGQLEDVVALDRRDREL